MAPMIASTPPGTRTEPAVHPTGVVTGIEFVSTRGSVG